jgi:hypothetical protein
MITGRSELADNMVPMQPAKSGWRVLRAVAAALILTACIIGVIPMLA